MESTRKKSCNQCRLAKTRCSLDIPSCARCEKRKLSCRYQHQTPKRPLSPHVQDGMFHSWLMATNSTFAPPITHNYETPMTLLALDNRNSGAFQISDGSLLNDMERSGIDWSLDHALFSMLPSVVDGDLARPDNIVETPETERQESVCWVERSPPANSRSIRDLHSDQRERIFIAPEDGEDILSEMSSAMRQSWKFVLASLQAIKNVPGQIPNIFERKKTSNVSDTIKDNFMWSRIMSYVTDFDTSMLPPFVHQRCLMKDDAAQESDFVNLPEALANCRNIVPMYLQKTPACKNMVLKTLLLEVQRLHTEFRNYDENTLLCALQALTIYVIMLAADRKPCNLMRIITGIAMGEVANAIQDQGYFCVAETRGNFPKWSDWVLHESKRRTLIVLHVIYGLLDMNVSKARAEPCAHFEAIALPCSRSMWQAKTTSAWEDEYKKYLSLRAGSAMPTVGNLRKAHGVGGNELEADLVKDLSTWSKDADDLGALLLMMRP